MITASELWDLYKDVDGSLYCLDEETWTRGEPEQLSWRNQNPTTPNPDLVAQLEEDLVVLQDVITKLKCGWGLA